MEHATGCLEHGSAEQCDYCAPRYALEGEQVTARQAVKRINSWTWAGAGSCYCDLQDGQRVRISRARTVKGEVQGRVIIGSPQVWITRSHQRPSLNCTRPPFNRSTEKRGK